MKKILVLLLTLALIITMCAGCGGTEEGGIIDQTEDYWTDDQTATIHSLKQLSDDGYVYTLDYTADYELDTLISENIVDGKGLGMAFQEKILGGKSKYEFPEMKAPEESCSAFVAVNDQGHRIMGRNDDWYVDDRYTAVINTKAHPESGSKYATVGVADMGFLNGYKETITEPELVETLLVSPYMILDGINDQGLACAALQLDYDGMIQRNPDKKYLGTLFIPRLILDKTKTVDEAIKLLSKYNIITYDFMNKLNEEDKNPLAGKSMHWIISDAKGDNAVIEYVYDEKSETSKLRVTRDLVNIRIDGFDDKLGQLTALRKYEKPSDYLIMTNFYNSPKSDDLVAEGFGRYSIIYENLKKNPHPSNEAAMKILEDARYSRDFDLYVWLLSIGKNPYDEKDRMYLMSNYSVVYDMDDGKLNICGRENYDDVNEVVFLNR